MATHKKKKAKKKLTVKEKIIAMVCLLVIGASWTVIGVKAATTINPPVNKIGVSGLAMPLPDTKSHCNPKYHGRTLVISDVKDWNDLVANGLCLPGSTFAVQGKSPIFYPGSCTVDTFYCVSNSNQALIDEINHLQPHDNINKCELILCDKSAIVKVDWGKAYCGGRLLFQYGQECQWDQSKVGFHFDPTRPDLGPPFLQWYDMLNGHTCADKKDGGGKPMCGDAQCNHDTCKMDYSGCHPCNNVNMNPVGPGSPVIAPINTEATTK